ncbi:putative bifunctional diguanylate cyclase/phosphodiesterase [Anaerovorax odorimutans]|uniref:putative bifunctional diguanylate cyclase/phosphodiesterase n=1 Tax=Anaerovorax odorimutans TaxID=109327 RepID=UPI00040869C4|nr:GGDEF domain-containing phosphodiesterase [Anaerovorax odorimutans]
MKKIAYTDPVTGGLNYNKFRVDAELILKSNKKEQFALVCTDIDNFSYINYTFGYKFGDKILAKISNIINKNLGTDELCARRSDDTFVLLLKFKDKNSVKKRLSLLHNKCNEIKSIKDNNYTLFMKKGIYIIHKKEYDISLIVGKAEHSKRTIKTSLTNTLSFYDDKIHKELLHEKALENSIASSLKKNEFVVYLQPKISLTTKEIIGAEALVRWQHPLEGLISPDKFIPLFESNGYIVDLDFYVYKKVCTLLKKWIDNNKPLIPISVNVSRLHVANNNFANSFKKIVDEYKIPSNLLELELTENIFLKNVSDVLNMINALKKMGFILSIDDFGCGYSSLNLLKELPVDIVKLDKGFFKPDGLDKKDKYVVSGIINIAKDLNLQVLSEGVETQEQAEFLQSSQCDMAQGFLFAKPMPIEDFETLLKETNNTI